MARRTPKTKSELASLTADVLVLGGGPGGLAIAAALAQRGLRTTLIAADLSDRWAQSYGDFLSEFRGLELGSAVKRVFEKPLVWGASERAVSIREPYARLDTGYLQSLLFERCGRAGVELYRGRAVKIEEQREGRVTTLLEIESAPGAAPVGFQECSSLLVVDATGLASSIARRPMVQPAGFQSAYGQWIEVDAHPYADTEMALMDYRVAGDGGPPSFLYALPETGESKGPGTLFVQETVLFSPDPVNMGELADRLQSRLDKMGISAVRTLGTERCVIPMGGGIPELEGSVVAFGAAAGLVHPATGYQLSRALRAAPEVAEAIAQHLSLGGELAAKAGFDALWSDERRRAWQVYEVGAMALAEMSPGAMRGFISQFFSLPRTDWLPFMTGELEASEIMQTMLRVFAGAPNSLRGQLIRGGTRAAATSLAAAAHF